MTLRIPDLQAMQEWLSSESVWFDNTEIQDE